MEIRKGLAMLGMLAAAWLGARAGEKQDQKNRRIQYLERLRKVWRPGRRVEDMSKGALYAMADTFPPSPQIDPVTRSLLKMWVMWWMTEAQKETSGHYQVLFGRVKVRIDAVLKEEPKNPLAKELSEIVDLFAQEGEKYDKVLGAIQDRMETERV